MKLTDFRRSNTRQWLSVKEMLCELDCQPWITFVPVFANDNSIRWGKVFPFGLHCAMMRTLGALR